MSLILDLNAILKNNNINDIDSEHYVFACKQYMLYAMKLHREPNKHRTYAKRIITLNYLEKCIDLFVFMLKKIETNPNLYTDYLNADADMLSKIIYIHSAIMYAFNSKIDSVIRETEYLSSLQHNYRYMTKMLNIDRTELPILGIKDIYRKRYNYYRFTKGYGKVKSCKLTFQDILTEYEMKKQSMILESDPSECSICYDQLGPITKITPCYHMFHHKCLHDWHTTCIANNNKTTCPICKYEINRN